MRQLEGKVAIVTGGGGGIGRGIALRFTREGAAVGVLDKNAAGCNRVVREIWRCRPARDRIAGRRQRRVRRGRICARVFNTFGPPTILAHTAGVMPTGTILETREEDWDHVYDVNVKGAFLACRQVIPHMRSAGTGSIILMASITGVNGLPRLAAYSGTKGALIALARALAIDHAAEGIRANSIAPGTIDSPMLHEFVAAQPDPERTRQVFDAVQPRGRVGTIEEVVNVVIFLASDQSSLINGANIPVDGGMSIKGEQPRF